MNATPVVVRAILFQSTLPAGGATARYVTKKVYGKFQSTLPAGGATDVYLLHDALARDFNPRSPQGERLSRPKLTSNHRGISIHAPRRGSDLNAGMALAYLSQFQSTLPAGGATLRWSGRSLPISDFNPRSPQGERRITSYCHGIRENFNPRSPQGERPEALARKDFNKLFQSTLPAGGATQKYFAVAKG